MFERFRSSQDNPKAADLLRKAFEDASSVAHIIIDLQDFYFGWEYVFARRQEEARRKPNHTVSNYDRDMKDLMIRVNLFANDIRGQITNIWMYHTQEPPSVRRKMTSEERAHYIAGAQKISGHPAPDEPVIGKRYFNAFDSHQLNRELARRKISTVLFSGVHFYDCVRESSIGARQNDLNVFIVDDLTDACFADQDPARDREMRQQGIHRVKSRDVEEAVALNKKRELSFAA